MGLALLFAPGCDWWAVNKCVGGIKIKTATFGVTASEVPGRFELPWTVLQTAT